MEAKQIDKIIKMVFRNKGHKVTLDAIEMTTLIRLSNDGIDRAIEYLEAIVNRDKEEQ